MLKYSPSFFIGLVANLLVTFCSMTFGKSVFHWSLERSIFFVSSKLGQLGIPNKIVEDLDSDDDKSGQLLWSNLDSEVKMGYQSNHDINF